MPPKKTIPKVEVVEDNYQTRAERRMPPSLEASLMESIRKNLPEDEDPPELAMLAQQMPGLYAALLGKLTSGSSVRAAVISVGLPPGKVNYWLQIGAQDMLDGHDTYCSRFLRDVQRAASVAVSDAEERVFLQDPSKWLSRSPTGKQFHKDQFWNEQKALAGPDAGTPVEDNPLEPTPVEEQQALEHHSDDNEKEIEQDLAEAMKHLENTGIIQDPEFVKQAKAQFRIGKDNE